MCLIPSYTEIEKNKQVQKVLHLMTLPLDTEAKRKDFLYNLSFMNSMVVKGYMKEHTDMDTVIYDTKDKALDFIARKMANRCHRSSDGRHYIIYIYVNGRQYSYHTNSRHDLPYEDSKATKWDEIRDGWSLSDAEYQACVESNREKARYNQKEYEEYEHKITLLVKRLMLRGIKIARERNIENKKKCAEFWAKVDNGLTAAQKRTKAYKERNASKIISLYGTHLGMTWRDEPSSYIYTLPVSLLDDRGYYNGYWLAGRIDDMFCSMNLHI